MNRVVYSIVSGSQHRVKLSKGSLALPPMTLMSGIIDYNHWLTDHCERKIAAVDLKNIMD